MKNWDARLYFVAALQDEGRRDAAERFLQTLADMARIPQAEFALQPGGPEGEIRIDSPHGAPP